MEQVRSIEAILNITFPASYVETVLEYNGGRPNKQLVNLKEGGTLTFSHLFSLSLEDSSNILEIFQYRLNNNFPKHLICFGTDPFGTGYYFDYSMVTNNEPRIINIGEVWEERLDEAQYILRYEPNIVADCFEDFLKSLQRMN